MTQRSRPGQSPIPRTLSLTLAPMACRPQSPGHCPRRRSFHCHWQGGPVGRFTLVDDAKRLIGLRQALRRAHLKHKSGLERCPAYHDRDSSAARLSEGKEEVVRYAVVLNRVLVHSHVVDDAHAVVLLLLLPLLLHLRGVRQSN